jgi:hypothetical protein
MTATLFSSQKKFKNTNKFVGIVLNFHYEKYELDHTREVPWFLCYPLFKLREELSYLDLFPKECNSFSENIKQVKGNECSQCKSTQSAHLAGLFSPCHA